MNAIHPDAVIASPVGPLGLRLAGDALAGLDFLSAATPLQGPRTDPARRAADALAAYFRDPRAVPALPVADVGTPFQRRVWAALAAIPCGQTRTYGELAAALGTAPRAVGGACRANPVPILVPCHRVLAAGGPGGYSGARGGRWLEIKGRLLVHEGVVLAAAG